MNEKTQTSDPLKNFVVVMDGEVLTPPEPNALEMAGTSILNGISRAVDHVRLETRMVVFDALHGTNYRQIRHNLAAQKKRERFEASIGLVAIGKK